MKDLRKKQSAIIFIILVSLIPTFGKVTFNLIFSDPEGMGFNAPKNQWMINTTQEAAEMLGDIIKHPAHVNIEIKSNPNINYARSLGKYFHIIEDNLLGPKSILEAHYKILNENTINNNTLQGHIEFNISKFNQKHKHLLGKVIIHELTHALGFSPWKIENHNSPYYNDFDKLLHDGNNNPFLVGEDTLTINPEFNSELGLYATGPNIKTLNNGQSIKLHTPKTFECGTSFAHLDSDAHPQSIMNAESNDKEYPIWNKYELGIMQDLGYKIDWEQYCSIIHKLFPSKLTIHVNASELEGTETQFQISGNHFPQTCFNKTNDELDFTVMLNHSSRITLIDTKTNDILFSFSPHDSIKQDQCVIGEKYFRIKYHSPFRSVKKKLHIRFIEENPSYQTIDSFFDRLLKYFSND